MTYCKRPGCKHSPWKHDICYRHYRENQGHIFDPVGKVFVKPADTKDKSALAVEVAAR